MDIKVAGEEDTVVLPDPPTESTQAYGQSTTTRVAAQNGAQLTGGRTFEKASVTKVTTKISGRVEVEMNGEDVSIDDRVRLCGEFRVVAINHKADPKDGSIVREQVLQPLADTPLDLVPFDSMNPNDNGIVRMRP